MDHGRALAVPAACACAEPEYLVNTASYSGGGLSHGVEGQIRPSEPNQFTSETSSIFHRFTHAEP
jgi:hypothetical protein